MGEPAWTEYERLEVISKEKKDSEEMPLHFIPKWYYENRPLPQYRYAIESENKELIEEVLKANPILPLDYHYLLYRDEDNHPKGIAIKDDDDLFGPSIIKAQIEIRKKCRSPTSCFLPKNRCKVSWNGHFQMNREMQPITRHSMCLSPILLDRGALVPHPTLSVSIKTLQNITKTNTPMPE